MEAAVILWAGDSQISLHHRHGRKHTKQHPWMTAMPERWSVWGKYYVAVGTKTYCPAEVLDDTRKVSTMVQRCVWWFDIDSNRPGGRSMSGGFVYSKLLQVTKIKIIECRIITFWLMFKNIWKVFSGSRSCILKIIHLVADWHSKVHKVGLLIPFF